MPAGNLADENPDYLVRCAVLPPITVCEPYFLFARHQREIPKEYGSILSREIYIKYQPAL